jgi:hypothetical protein
MTLTVGGALQLRSYFFWKGRRTKMELRCVWIIRRGHVWYRSCAHSSFSMWEDKSKTETDSWRATKAEEGGVSSFPSDIEDAGLPRSTALARIVLSQSTNGGGPIVVQGKMGSSYSPGIGIPSCQYQERQTFLLFYLYCFRLYLFCTIPPLSISSSSSSYQRKIPSLSLSPSRSAEEEAEIYIIQRAQPITHNDDSFLSFSISPRQSQFFKLLFYFLFYFILFLFLFSIVSLI